MSAAMFAEVKALRQRVEELERIVAQLKPSDTFKSVPRETLSVKKASA